MTDQSTPAPKPETPKGPAPDPNDKRILVGRWGTHPNYACAGQGCRFASLDRGQTLTHVAHCRRLTKD